MTAAFGETRIAGFDDVTAPEAALRWRAARRKGWRIQLQPDSEGRGLVVDVAVDPDRDARPPYIRQQMAVRGRDVRGILRATCSFAPLAGPTALSLSLFLLDDAGQAVVEGKSKTKTGAGETTLVATLDSSRPEVSIASDAGYQLVFQLNVFGESKFRIDRVGLALLPSDRAAWRPSVAFFSFGGVTKASSRLRVFKLADELRELGCEVAINPSVERDTRFDVAVFQKVRPFAKAHRLAQNGALLVYDMDDNYLLEEQGTKASVVGFLNVVDRVTVGSERIAEDVRPYHRDVTMLENPVDILDERGPFRQPRGECRQVGWFGAPENRYQLEALGLPEIVTITKGGDVEWSLQTVDGALMELDLVVIPVSRGDWNLSKNANRMIKALALGVPVLASDVAEHRAVVRRLGLPEWTLVGSDDRRAWIDAIDRARRDYRALEQEVDRARERAREEWSAARIVRGWLDGLSGPQVPALPTRKRAAAKVAHPRPLRAIFLDLAGRADVMAWIKATHELLGEDATALYATMARDAPEARLVRATGLGESIADEPLQLFTGLDRWVRGLSDDAWLLVVSEGFELTKATEVVLGSIDERDVDFVFLGSTSSHGVDALPTNVSEAADSFWRFEDPGPLLARVRAIRALGLEFAVLRDHWPWAALHVATFATPARVSVSSFPASVRKRSRHLARLNATYRATSREPAFARNEQLASELHQWHRMREDLMIDVVQRIPDSFRPLLVSRGVTAVSDAHEKIRRSKGG